MKATRTYQFRLYTTKAGYERIDDVLGQCQRLYNAALEERKTAWKGHGIGVSFKDQSAQLTLIRKDDPDGYGGFNRRLAVGALDRLHNAFQAFFRRVKAGETPGYPRFKAYARWRTLDPKGIEKAWFKGDHLKMNGLPIMRLKRARAFPDGNPLAVKITRKGRRLTASITYEVELEATTRPQKAAVGVDMGVSDRMTLSDGAAVPRRKRTRKAEIEVKQRRLSASKRGSKRRRKRAAILANARDRERIANRNEVHQVTTAIVRRYGMIAIEDLAIKNMTASAAGTLEEPGKNVAQKRGLNRSIQEQTWGIIRQQLEYKAEWAGRKLIAVNPRHTSQRCSACGLIEATNRRGKYYVCRGCGMIEDADVNAARNILRAAEDIAARDGPDNP